MRVHVVRRRLVMCREPTRSRCRGAGMSGTASGGVLCTSAACTGVLARIRPRRRDKGAASHGALLKVSQHQSREGVAAAKVDREYSLEASASFVPRQAVSQRCCRTTRARATQASARAQRVQFNLLARATAPLATVASLCTAVAPHPAASPTRREADRQVRRSGSCTLACT